MRKERQRAIDALAADAQQAAYYRGVLADRLALVEQDLDGCRTHLAARLRSGDSHALGRLRRELRRREIEHRDIDRLITALDRRFGAR